MEFTRILLQDSETANAVFALGQDEGWNVYNIVPAGESQPFEKVWVSGRSGVHYIDDPMLGVHYFLVEGDGREAVEARIRSRLKTYSDADIAQAMRSAASPGDQVRAVCHAGVAAPQAYDERYVGYLRSALVSPHPEVRYAGVLMCGFVAWRQLQDDLERIKERDPSAEIREFAGVVLSSLEHHNWTENPDG